MTGGEGDTQGETRPPRVFISYSHPDSVEHQQCTLALADQLGAGGIDGEATMRAVGDVAVGHAADPVSEWGLDGGRWRTLADGRFTDTHRT